RGVLHAEHGQQRADYLDVRQSDRPLLPRRSAADDRGGSDDHPVRLPGGADGLLHALDPPGIEGAGTVSEEAAALPTPPRSLTGWAKMRGWMSNPWGKPRFLVVFTWMYIAWSIVPVLIAIQFSFNNSRSRTLWHGFSLRWYTFDPNSVT